MQSPFETVLTNLTQGVALVDADLRVVLANDRLSELLQIPMLMVGADAGPITAHMPAGDRSKWLAHLSGETEPLHQEILIGVTLVAITSIPVTDGQWLIQCEDISALSLMKKDLSDQSGLFDTALDNMPHGLCMYDAHKNLMLCNAAYSRLYDLSEHLTRPGTPCRKFLIIG